MKSTPVMFIVAYAGTSGMRPSSEKSLFVSSSVRSLSGMTKSDTERSSSGSVSPSPDERPHLVELAVELALVVGVGGRLRRVVELVQLLDDASSPTRY